MTFAELCSVVLENNLGPIYHGGKWDGKTPIKMSRGALGYGAYFTPSLEIAEYYAKQNAGVVTQVNIDIRNPLVIKLNNSKPEHPCVLALKLLGMPEKNAEKLVEKVEEMKGYMGKEISTRAIAAGYDGIYEFFNDKLREIVVWNSNKVTKI